MTASTNEFQGRTYVITGGASGVGRATAHRFGQEGATNIIIATGARARQLPNLKPDGKRVLSSTEAMIMDHIPESMVVIGAGAIGMEFAYFYKTFGSKISIVEMMPNLLPYLAATLVNAVSNAILASIGLEVLGLGPLDAPTLGMTLYWVNFNAAIINGWWWWWAAPSCLPATT